MNLSNIAQEYYDLGLTSTCISYLKTEFNIKEVNPDKSPCHPWRRWQIRRPELKEISSLPWGNASGIGAVLGNTRSYGKHHRCIDIDNCSNIELIKDILRHLYLPEDYEWVVKTPNGYHIHVFAGDIEYATSKDMHEGVLALLPNETYKNKFSRIELRWANHIVLPPTNINGLSYEFAFHDNQIPINEPRKIDSDLTLFFLAKYCGSHSEKFDMERGNKAIVNDFYFEVTYGSSDSSYRGIPDMITVFKLPNVNENIINAENNSDLIYSSYIDKQFSPLFLDLETTGLINNPTNYELYPRIIQIAYTEQKVETINNERRLVTIITNHYIKPDDFTVPKEIENLTGLNDSYLSENGIGIEDVLMGFRFINERQSHIISYNTEFDMPIIDSEYLRLQKTKPYIDNYLRKGGLQIFCLMKKINSEFGGKYFKLSEAYEFLFKEALPIKPHNAVNDVEILMDCFYLMSLFGYIRQSNNGKILI